MRHCTRSGRERCCAGNSCCCWLAETAGTGNIEPGQDYSASSSNRHAGALQSYTTWNNLELGLVSLWNSYTWHSVMFHNYLENFLEQNINSAKAAYFSVLETPELSLVWLQYQITILPHSDSSCKSSSAEILCKGLHKMAFNSPRMIHPWSRHLSFYTGLLINY